MKTKTVSIDGKSYTLAEWSGDKGFTMLIRLGKAIGEPMALAFEAKGKKDQDVDALLGKALGKFFSSTCPEEALSLVKDCLERTLVGSTPVTDEFDKHFGSKMAHLFKVTIATVKFQYSDFSGALASMKELGLAGAGSESQST